MSFNVAVLASGRGTNFRAVVKAIKKGEVNANITLLITDNPSANVLAIARKEGVKSVVIEKKINMNREEHEKLIHEELVKNAIDLVVLAGYMRILSPFFVSRWKWRMINTHPSLLPAFGGKGMYGEHVHRAVLNSGTRYSGCTVHFVTENPDQGPIIDQTVVRVSPDDTIETLAKKILKKEHILLPKVIDLIEKNKVKVNNNKVYISR